MSNMQTPTASAVALRNGASTNAASYDATFDRLKADFETRAMCLRLIGQIMPSVEAERKLAIAFAELAAEFGTTMAEFHVVFGGAR